MTESIPRSGPRSSSRRRPPVLGAQAKQSTYALIPPGMYLSQSLPSSATASSRWSATRSATTSAHGALRARIRCICRRRRCSTGAVRSDPRLCWHGTSLRWIGRSSSRYAETPVSSTGPKRQHRDAQQSSSTARVVRRARLQDKVCVITGAGSGIGSATARLFAAEGARVVVADVDDRGAKATVAGIRKNGGDAVAEHVDVTDEQDTVALAARVTKRFKRIDVLFNNAGISGVGDVLETDPDLFDRVMKVNVRGVYLMSRAVVPHMIKQRSGSIINMSSCIAEIGLARRVSYAASKGAVLSMTKSMQVDVAQHGIRVNALLPGTILTPFVERYLKESYKDPEEGYASIRKRQLTSELGRPSRSSRLPLKERWPSLSLGHWSSGRSQASSRPLPSGSRR